jgi:hypothetical protein
MQRPPLPAILWPEGLSKKKIEPATFRLVARCLNQLRHSVPPYHLTYTEQLNPLRALYLHSCPLLHQLHFQIMEICCCLQYYDDLISFNFLLLVP